MKFLVDKFGRKIDYLRISVTERCNLRCIYCVPGYGVIQNAQEEVLTTAEIVTFVRAAVSLGIRKIKITGGEPLIRKDIVKLISDLNDIDGIQDISMTSNGILLSKYASDLKSAGLSRVNISLDSLNTQKYKQITRFGELRDVFKGIDMAERVGLSPLKINSVIIRNINSDEILDFAEFSIKTGLIVRFIEYMPTNNVLGWSREKYMPNEEIKNYCDSSYNLIHSDMKGNGPARYYKIHRTKGVIGFISPLSCNFCNKCNRLRITSDGRLLSCLYSESWHDVKKSLRNNSNVQGIISYIMESIQSKVERHYLEYEEDPREYCVMSTIGG